MKRIIALILLILILAACKESKEAFYKSHFTNVYKPLFLEMPEGYTIGSTNLEIYVSDEKVYVIYIKDEYVYDDNEIVTGVLQSNVL